MISDEALLRAKRVMEAASDDFATLSRTAGRDPRTGWRGADLSGVDFGEDDLSGFSFVRCLLQGANFSQARGLRREMFVDAAWDETTKFPQGLGLPAHRMRPPLDALAQWREPVPGLPEEAWPDMVTIPAGVFLMGAPKDEEGSDRDERPQRRVTVSRPFGLGRTAVTFAMWDAAVAAGFTPPKGAERPDDQGWGREQRPVIHVSWHDAQAYCAWLNQRLGLPAGTYRLPREAEWEYACRAGTETPFSFGETISTEQANYAGDYAYGAGRKGQSRRRTVPVGSLPANPWGLREMHGNTYEWVEDAHGRYPAGETDSCPLDHPGADARVVRAGSWDSTPQLLRSAFRYRHQPELRFNLIGFRLARTPGG